MISGLSTLLCYWHCLFSHKIQFCLDGLLVKLTLMVSLSHLGFLQVLVLYAKIFDRKVNANFNTSEKNFDWNRECYEMWIVSPLYMCRLEPLNKSHHHLFFSDRSSEKHFFLLKTRQEKLRQDNLSITVYESVGERVECIQRDVSVPKNSLEGEIPCIDIWIRWTLADTWQGDTVADHGGRWLGYVTRLAHINFCTS